MTLKINVFEKKTKIFKKNWPFSLFRSTCYQFSIMTKLISHFVCSRKAQLKILGGTKYGFTASTEFSPNFFCCF